jgi:predicted PurR-regulated permease PerM
VTAALVVGTTFAPVVKASARRGIPSWVTAGVIGLSLVAIAALVLTFLAQPLTDWIARAPEMGAMIKQKLYVLDKPLNALRELQEALLPPRGKAVEVEPPLAVVTPVLALVTPAVIQFVLFFVTLVFFLAAQMDFRRYMATFFTTREGKLRFIRITNDIERRLVSYLVTVTVINLCLGIAVTLGAWLFGLSSPVLFGLVAMVLNYIPYVGAACMTFLLLAVGLVSFSQLAFGIEPAAAFVLLATIEGQFITPAVLGRRLTLNPLAVLLAIAFWSWIWGPMGTFLAVPLTIGAFVTLYHLFPPDESKLPG